MINNVRDGNATGWRLESSLREFPNITPIEFWFEHPIHRVDSGAFLKALPAQGSFAAGKMKNSRSKSGEEANSDFRRAFDILCMGSDSVAIKDIAEYLELAPKTIYGRVDRMEEEFKIEKKRVYRLEPLEDKDLEPDLPGE